ncbi:hypothetical protein DFP72DRAFT_1061642 [Ephemerocybe angulata]|uniref:Uncharacterized protein n=1 Tax=Ephemerocybe angulata TaxID=980116 RepID=A0A8H6IBI5_9AGAR|nr:hypothetical protein DFP72DRAFT_1061642 [Tulosesus angulatus]
MDPSLSIGHRCAGSDFVDRSYTHSLGHLPPQWPILFPPPGAQAANVTNEARGTHTHGRTASHVQDAATRSVIGGLPDYYDWHSPADLQQQALSQDPRLTSTTFALPSFPMVHSDETNEFMTLDNTHQGVDNGLPFTRFTSNLYGIVPNVASTNAVDLFAVPVSSQPQPDLSDLFFNTEFLATPAGEEVSMALPDFFSPHNAASPIETDTVHMGVPSYSDTDTVHMAPASSDTDTVHMAPASSDTDTVHMAPASSDTTDFTVPAHGPSPTIPVSPPPTSVSAIPTPTTASATPTLTQPPTTTGAEATDSAQTAGTGSAGAAGDLTTTVVVDVEVIPGSALHSVIIEIPAHMGSILTFKLINTYAEAFKDLLGFGLLLCKGSSRADVAALALLALRRTGAHPEECQQKPSAFSRFRCQRHNIHLSEARRTVHHMMEDYVLPPFINLYYEQFSRALMRDTIQHSIEKVLKNPKHFNFSSFTLPTEAIPFQNSIRDIATTASYLHRFVKVPASSEKTPRKKAGKAPIQWQINPLDPPANASPEDIRAIGKAFANRKRLLEKQAADPSYQPSADENPGASWTVNGVTVMQLTSSVYDRSEVYVLHCQAGSVLAICCFKVCWLTIRFPGVVSRFVEDQSSPNLNGERDLVWHILIFSIAVMAIGLQAADQTCGLDFTADYILNDPTTNFVFETKLLSAEAALNLFRIKHPQEYGMLRTTVLELLVASTVPLAVSYLQDLLPTFRIDETTHLASGSRASAATSTDTILPGPFTGALTELWSRNKLDINDRVKNIQGSTSF